MSTLNTLKETRGKTATKFYVNDIILPAAASSSEGKRVKQYVINYLKRFDYINIVMGLKYFNYAIEY